MSERPADKEERFQDLVSPDGMIGVVVNEKYKIVGRIGAGGMGTVYRGEDLYIGRPIAIKFLKPDLLENSEYLERFKREARIASRLNHPNAIAMFDYGVFKGLPYLVMQFVEGITLKEELMSTGALPLDRVANILDQVGAALSAAHSMGVVHRDLKPDNVMLSGSHNSRETALILDFGIAKPLSIFGNSGGQELTRAGVFMGTPLYMSPEQALDRPCDARSDIYALGIILYEMITGEVPFRSSSPVELLVRHINDIPVPIREFRPELNIPAAISDVVAKALEKDPDSRFQTIDELVRKFSAASAGVVKRQPFGVAPRPLTAARTEKPISEQTAEPTAADQPLKVSIEKASEAVRPEAATDSPPQVTPISPLPHRSGKSPVLAVTLLLVLIAAGFFGYREFGFNKTGPADKKEKEGVTVAPSAIEKDTDSKTGSATSPVEQAEIKSPAENSPKPDTAAPPAKEAILPGQESESNVVADNGPAVSSSPAVSLPVEDAQIATTSAAAQNDEVRILAEVKKEEAPPSIEEPEKNIAVPEEKLADAPPPAGSFEKAKESAQPGNIEAADAGDNAAASSAALAGDSGDFGKYSLKEIQSEIAARPGKDDRKLSDQLYAEGRTLFNSKDYSGAADKFKQALVTCEANLGARLSLASSLLRLGSQPDALDHFKFADNVQPDYPPTLYGFASYFAIRGEADQAVNYLKRAIALYPKIKNWPADDSDFDPIRSDPDFQKLTAK